METALHQNKTFDTIDYSDQRLSDNEFVNCEFINCNFSKSDLTSIDFLDCTFKNCNLSFNTSKKDFTFRLLIDDLKLMPGDYLMTVALAVNNTTIDIKEEIIGFTIIPDDIYGTGKIPKGNFLTYSKSIWELKEK